VKATKHIRFQYDARFARCHRFKLYLFDKMQRHAAARSVAARIKSTPSSFAKLAEWVLDPSFLTRLAEAAGNPHQEASSTLIKQIMPHISVASAKVSYSTAQRRAAMAHLYAMVYHYGVPSVFFTFAPDDVHGILNMRMAILQVSNWDFPANGEGFTAAL